MNIRMKNNSNEWVRHDLPRYLLLNLDLLLFNLISGLSILLASNVSSISGVHYHDNANLCNNFHIKHRAYRNYAAHDMIIRC